MKRAVVALVMLGMGAVTAAPSMASTTVYGSAQLKYTVNATAAISIATNYTAAAGGPQSAAASTILAGGTGTCSAGAIEATASLTFGGITPPANPANYQTCYYKNAISVGVNSNDASGVSVYEFVDTLQANTAICAYPLNAVPAASPTTSGATAAMITGSGACPTVNSVNGQALVAKGATTAGTGFGGAGAPGGTDVTATPTATLLGAAGGYTLYTSGASAPPAGWNFLGQDISTSVNGAAASGAQTSVITFELIAN